MDNEIIKEFSTAWLRSEIETCRKGLKSAPKMTLTLLLGDLERYVEHISKNAGNKGRSTSARKAASSAANGRKGGRPKGSKNKPKETNAKGRD